MQLQAWTVPVVRMLTPRAWSDAIIDRAARASPAYPVAATGLSHQPEPRDNRPKPATWAISLKARNPPKI